MLAAPLAAATAVVAAVLSLASAAYVARATRRTGKDIELIRAELASDMAEQQSRRDYELAARRRIYDEAEPLILKLAASCDFAAERIVELADPRRWPQFDAVRDSSFWMLSRSSQVIATARALLEPLAVYTLLSEQLTLVDTSLDSRICEIYTLAPAAYGLRLEPWTAATQPRTTETTSPRPRIWPGTALSSNEDSACSTVPDGSSSPGAS